MFSFLVALVIAAQVSEFAANDLIQFPSKKYVKPGDSFELECSTDDAGIVDAIHAPNEEIPSDEELRNASLAKTNKAFTHARGSSAKQYDDASIAAHAGLYTCVVFRQNEPVVVKATCEVIIKDLCEDVECPEPKTCVGDYETGISSCQCVFDCPITGFTLEDFICTDHCDQMTHECEMREKNCLEGEDRKEWMKGLCPFPYNSPPKPQIIQAEGTQLVEPQLGEEVTFDSGIVKDGTPPAEVTWTVNSVEVPEFKNMHQYVVVAGLEILEVECKIVHCRNEDKAIFNRYLLRTELIPPPTSTEPPENIIPPLYPVCSIFPGGAIEEFNTAAAFYDMACTHVLAADFSPGGDYTQPWFVYGTFDKHDGDSALSSMTFYVGRSTAFEFQRGWVINNMGEKFLVEENVPRILGDCEITYRGLHLVAKCPHFYGYYDGVMSGHIRLGDTDTTPSKLEPIKGFNNIGLCWDNQSGFRPNWQVASPRGCEIDTSLEKCEESRDCDGYVIPPYSEVEMPWAFRALAARQSCNELHCDDHIPTEVQECALIQADNVNLYLRTNKELVSKRDVTGCPLLQEECVWKEELVKRGCPQDKPPFKC